MRVDIHHHFDLAILKTINQIRSILVTNQEKIDALGTSLQTLGDNLTTALAGLRGDIQNLKNAVENDRPLDFTAVETKLATAEEAARSLTDLDAENPPPVNAKKGKAKGKKAAAKKKGK